MTPTEKRELIVGYELAVKITDAVGLDPVDVGL